MESKGAADASPPLYDIEEAVQFEVSWEGPEVNKLGEVDSEAILQGCNGRGVTAVGLKAGFSLLG